MKLKKFYKWRLNHVLKRSRLDMFRTRLIACEKIRVTRLYPGMRLKYLECFKKPKSGRRKYPSKWLYLKRYSPPLPRLIRANLIKPTPMGPIASFKEAYEKPSS